MSAKLEVTLTRIGENALNIVVDQRRQDIAAGRMPPALLNEQPFMFDDDTGSPLPALEPWPVEDRTPSPIVIDGTPPNIPFHEEKSRPVDAAELRERLRWEPIFDEPVRMAVAPARCPHAASALKYHHVPDHIVRNALNALSLFLDYETEGRVERAYYQLKRHVMPKNSEGKRLHNIDLEEDISTPMDLQELAERPLKRKRDA
ncbi:hypothetical protein CPB85DRAFT_1436728 [Mucidula mucida]|nr:hypothetical protein CPB85DRAFT_1436728 [Mucidula mucida]